MLQILLVDGDASFRRVYAAALKQAGLAADHASSAQDALLQLKSKTYHAVVSEILLPGKNGIRLIQDIRLQPKHLSIPIFILTTLEAADVGIPASLAQSLGVRAYLVKQQTKPSQLAGAIQALLPAP